MPELNGLTYEGLSSNLELDGHLTAFDNQTIRTVVIKNWPSEDFLYTVFLRLNSGSLPLSPQELRQALHPGRFTQAVNLFAEANLNLKAILGLDSPDFRMRDTELVVRYLGFRNFLGEYTGNLKPLLDKVVIFFNREWDEQETRLFAMLEDLDKALQATISIFGADRTFRKWNGTRFEKNINRAIFDIMVHTLDTPRIRAAAVNQGDEVISAFKSLCEQNDEFRASIEGTTKSIAAIRFRLESWAAALSTAINADVKLPRLPGDRRGRN